VLETSNRFQPPGPVPRGDPLGPLGLMRALWNNPLEAWSEAHFRERVVTAGLGLGHVAVVSCPDAIRRVLVDHRPNYRKDAFQRRVTSALGSGLLAAEGEQWHVQRRTLAPIFTRKAVLSFSPAMAETADELVERWRARSGRLVDVAADVTRLTLEVLERTIFSDGLSRNTEDVRAAMRVYFDSIGRIDPLDILGVPDFGSAHRPVWSPARACAVPQCGRRDYRHPSPTPGGRPRGSARYIGLAD